jgi:signal transduction histidine kinase
MRSRSAKELLVASWLLPVACTFLGGVLLALGLSFLDYSNYRRSETERLNEMAPTIGRRIYAELLLGEHGTLEPVIAQLEAEYGLSKIQLPKVSNSEQAGIIAAEWAIPNDGQKIGFERLSRPFTSFVQFRNFLLAFLPTLLLAGLGFLLQRRFLREHFIVPLEALAQTSVGGQNPDPKWPTEIQKISRELSASFANREQAIFGHVARGIIHDIRTNLNSMSTATQLVVGAKNEESRRQRLEKLLSASARNIPKIKEIVDLSLDSSREISMSPRLEDLTETILQAVDTISEMAEANGVSVDTQLESELSIVHDPVQMERVIVNLLKNAIEASAEMSGSRTIKVDLVRSESGATITVEDSGKGIADTNSLFRPLSSSKRHGVGLGLFVSKKIVEAHKGNLIPANSGRLGGARFSVELPAEGCV